MSQEYPDLSKIQVEDQWACFEADVEGRPMIGRIRANLKPLAGHPKLSQRLRVVWEYPAGDDSKLPGEADMAAMQKCEDALVEALERENHALLTHVLTCDGLRQWIFYCADLQEAAQRINEKLPHDPPLPIDLSGEPDADWSEYRETLSNLGL